MLSRDQIEIIRRACGASISKKVMNSDVRKGGRKARGERRCGANSEIMAVTVTRQPLEKGPNQLEARRDLELFDERSADKLFISVERVTEGTANMQFSILHSSTKRPGYALAPEIAQCGRGRGRATGIGRCEAVRAPRSREVPFSFVGAEPRRLAGGRYRAFL